MTGTLFDRIRAGAARVAALARFVRIDDTALARLAASLAEPASTPAQLDPAHHHLGSDAETLAFVVSLDAINFGSGWFPHLRKRAGCSGYFTIAGALRDRFASQGPYSARELQRLDARAVAELLGQPRPGVDPELDELMGYFARALVDLGTLLEREHGGEFGTLVHSALGRAELLVARLAVMPLYRDVAIYAGQPVPLYKRAQLTASDLALAFEGQGPGRFEDLRALTIFADNLVPHVLRREGVLCYEAGLAARIDAQERLAPGSREEIEIRAVALHAVERMVDTLRAAGRADVTAQRLDHLLWNRGQQPEMKAHPRHRARSVYY